MTPLPPYPRVQAALRITTERLALECAAPQPAAPDWTEFEWRIARAAATMHGVSGLLAHRLRWRGCAGWNDFLQGQREAIIQRQRALLGLRDEIAELFRALSIPGQVLKGAALLADGYYAAGERPMADLDLLVAPQHAARAAAALEQLGLRESHRTFKHRVFEPQRPKHPQSFGEDGASDAKVELHERICEPLPRRLLDITQRVSLQAGQPGLHSYPSRAALMAHLLLHAAGAMVWRTLRLIQLHDIALLSARLTPQDWQGALGGEAWWAWPPLALAERYYGPLAPRPPVAAARAACPALLRRIVGGQRLSAVSLSRLWIEAFPGIEWSGSAAEALRFVAYRLVPDAEVRADRARALACDPSLASGDWGRLSQGRRILRALTARTPRPWPLHNVRAALSQPH